MTHFAARSATTEDRLSRIQAIIQLHPDFPHQGVLYRDILPILSEPSLFHELIDIMSDIVKSNSCDMIAALEPKGTLLASAIAFNLRVPFAPIAKKGSLPGEVQRVAYRPEYYALELEVQSASLLPGQRVVIVDDVLASGETMAAACQLIKEIGAVAACCLVVMEIEQIKEREPIPPPVISLFEY